MFTKETMMKTTFRAAIKMENGKTLPIFAGRKSVSFKSIDKAVTKMIRTEIAGRGLVWPAGKTLADTSWNDIYTISL